MPARTTTGKNRGSLADFHEWLAEVEGVEWAERVDTFALKDEVLSARISDDADAVPPGETPRSTEVLLAWGVCFGISQYVFTSLNETEAEAISVRSSSGEILVTREPTDDLCMVEACDGADEVAGLHVPLCREDV